ncbi:amino acid transporter, partial [Amniculicola lignicola CBS 123094]
RYINQYAIINFTFCLQCAWIGYSITFQFAWANGGPAALVYGPIVAGFGSTAVAMSLAEMASMDPTVGAQYRWSARFAPRYPEFWGFMQGTLIVSGWITVFAWICNGAGAVAFVSNCISGLISFNSPTYVPQRWHATLILIACIMTFTVLNLALRKVINVLENVGGILQIMLFVSIVTVLLVLSKKSTPEFVFNTLTTESGWENPGVAWSIGLLTSAYPISSFDSVLHMVDETKQPRKQAPRSMVYGTGINSLLQFAFSICLLFCIGDTDSLSGPSLPIAEVFFSATNSKAVSTALVILMESIICISCFNVIASVSRLVWAFARDQGLPFSEYFTSIHPRLQVPIPALFLVCTICSLLSCINLGSAVAFNALIALPTLCLYISYTIPITLLLIRQVSYSHSHPILWGPWQLGRWSVPVKIFSLAYLVYVIVFVAFPTSRPVTKEGMNYSVPVFLGVVIMALGDWWVRGMHVFRVPIAPLVED